MRNAKVVIVVVLLLALILEQVNPTSRTVASVTYGGNTVSLVVTCHGFGQATVERGIRPSLNLKESPCPRLVNGRRSLSTVVTVVEFLLIGVHHQSLIYLFWHCIVVMAQETDVIWSSRPWIRPSLVLRTVLVIVAGILALAILSSFGVLTSSLLAIPMYVWVLGILAIAWLASLAGLMIMRASFSYVLRRSSLEVDQGIARKKSLIVSSSGFSELEVDQGIVGRLLNYGSLRVRSQGGQQLSLKLIRDPKGVSARVRDIMTTPTIRFARDEPPSATPVAEKK